MSSTKLALALVLAASLLALSGCASSTEESANDEDIDATSEEVTASAPLTIDNWVNHPRIVEVRKIAQAVDALKLTSEKLVGCNDVTYVTSKDASKHRRKLVETQELGMEALSTTAYYDDKGILRFVFDRVAAKNAQGKVTKIVETRTYLDAKANPFWAVVRDGNGTTFGAFRKVPKAELRDVAALVVEDVTTTFSCD